MSLSRTGLYATVLLACSGGFAWLYFNHRSPESDGLLFPGCIFKKITSYPCPSCGTTRAVQLLQDGEPLNSILMNPFGIIVAGLMIVLPVWVLVDLFSNGSSFLRFYEKIEFKLKNRKIAIFLIILVLLNWGWNLYKNV
ncbi:DUF2752 domain-containing protein [Robertkochia solimangrovi]|uniref:DUF2752 domain-containing protein n=1 Tax=Robertkochia solimangrovi TaxID=2213046 RepID=UPI00117CA862|nr:DUF2752 domain-containing protein [Robertkochia solimangrovi]TRZ46173.1 DUF2752 domain-containing protein [Robertkochia solimangrovi]